jgi:uncharacterized lipoprotein YddW (UPF0748 family)
MRRATALAVSCLALAGCSAGPQAAPAPAASTSPSPSPSPIEYASQPEYRALWVDAFHDGIKSPDQVDKLIADAHRANINALIIQVRKRGDAYFNVSDEPRATDIKGPADFDPLAYAIRLAHASVPRIEVHAWLNTFFMGPDSTVYRQHGSAWANRAVDGSTAGYFDPGVPAVQAYTQRIFLDVAKHYDVDGLHMDYVRYPGQTWGYNATSLARFRAATGVTDRPSPTDARWEQWRRDQVTQFVRELHAALHLARPSAKLSGALISYGGGPAGAAGWTLTSAYSSVFQDWRSWMLKGDLDFGVPMNYDSDWSEREKTWFDQWLNFEKNSGFADRIVTGVGAFLNYPEGTLAQIRRALPAAAAGRRVLGVAIYSYGSTSVYGSDDFFGSPDLAAGLPRQPYAGGITSPAGLASRARTFNSWFMTELALPDLYPDVQIGWVTTHPVFTMPAHAPTLSSR